VLNVSSSKLLEEIERFALDNQVDYVDACVTYCAKNEVDVEFLASIIKRDATFKSKMQAEAEDLNILKKTTKLPTSIIGDSYAEVA